MAAASSKAPHGSPLPACGERVRVRGSHKGNPLREEPQVCAGPRKGRADRFGALGCPSPHPSPRRPRAFVARDRLRMARGRRGEGVVSSSRVGAAGERLKALQSKVGSGRSLSLTRTPRKASARSVRSPPSSDFRTAAKHLASASSKNFTISFHLSMLAALLSTSQAQMFSRASAAMISPTSATISKLPRQLWMSGRTDSTS
jgi:hypothetical protein